MRNTNLIRDHLVRPRVPRAGGSLPYEPKTHTPNGFQFEALALELLLQAADKVVDCVCVDHHVGAPDRVENFIPAQNPLFSFEQADQQVELCRVNRVLQELGGLVDLREPAQVNCCPGAVGDEEGTISLYLTEDSSLTSTLKPTEVKVRVRTVDSVVASVRKWQGETPLNFCRLNIQGGELAAL